MTNRREFLQVAAAATGATAAARAGFAADGALAAGPLALAAVIVDRRFPEARAFGERLAGRGAPVRSIDADITDLWRDELRPMWAREPAAIAGLTARPALFLLERLAWEHRMRVVFHAEHEPLAGGGFAHAVLQGGAGFAAADLEAAGDYWADALARALEGLPGSARTAGPTPAGLAARLEEPSEPLVSWVIAPLARPASDV
jgi:hypothetical protein